MVSFSMIIGATVLLLVLILAVLSRFVHIPGNPFERSVEVLLFKLPAEINTLDKYTQYMQAHNNPFHQDLDNVGKFYLWRLSREYSELQELLNCATDGNENTFAWKTYLFCHKVMKVSSFHQVQGVISEINDILDNGNNTMLQLRRDKGNT
ncbi:MAG TPA: hypothetical protein GXX75_00120 [Clostridiales bacterium]|nr:hypothetical protein [Clostridiales bacterium]